MNPEPIRHVLLGSFQSITSDEQIQTFTDVFCDCVVKIDGVLSFEYGVYNSPEGKNRGFTHIFIITFADVHSRDAYLPHPEHQKFIQWAGQQDIIEDLLVFDYVPRG